MSLKYPHKISFATNTSDKILQIQLSYTDNSNVFTIIQSHTAQVPRWCYLYWSLHQCRSKSQTPSLQIGEMRFWWPTSHTHL